MKMQSNTQIILILLKASVHSQEILENTIENSSHNWNGVVSHLFCKTCESGRVQPSGNETVNGFEKKF